MRYYIWHDGQVKTSNNWDEVLACPGAYVMHEARLSARSFGFVLPFHQWISISPGDVPKAFQLGLLLLGIHL